MKNANTRQKILEVAQELIQRRGLNAMSFQDLSDAVGIRKASVHHHFASKADMVVALLQRYRVEFQRVVDDIVRSNVLGRTKLKRYFGLFVETGKSEKSCLCGMLIAEVSSLDEAGTQEVRAFLHENIEALQKIIQQGVQDGSLADQLPVQGTAEMILSTLEGGLMLSRCDGGPDQLAAMLSRLLSLLSTK